MTRLDSRRAGLISATRRMTVTAIVLLPIAGVAIAVLWAFRSARWSALTLSMAAIAMALICLVTAGLWRRLAELSDLTALNEQLRYRATHDLLMDVPNRELLHAELSHALAAGDHAPDRVGLLFFDLDRFKFVNDSLGHAAGDELLKAVGRRIQNVISSENALLARVGGDELVVLLRTLGSVPSTAAGPDAGLPTQVEPIQHLRLVADRVLAKFFDPFTIDGVKLNIGTSIGMAVSVAGESADDLYRHADAALYEAKQRGRGMAVFADNDLRAKRDARVRTELALRAALANNHIEAWFQPEVDMVTGEVIAAEALARWRTTDGIEIASSFIDVARRAGMLEELMIEMATQLWSWRTRSGSTLPVALNVSAAHLPSLLALHERDPIARPFHGLRLEIAETDIIHDFDGVRRSLTRLRELGAQVMLDDFGAGYSSLQMLTDLPIDGLKIDRSYIDRIETDWRVRNLVTSLAEYARSTNMIVVAEGVETSRQADFLNEIGVDRAQGFLFSGAVQPSDFAGMLAAGPFDVHLSSRF